MSDRRRRARVEIASRSVWRLRLERELPRRLLHALALVGLLASVRLAIDPPRAVLPSAALRAAAPPDRAAEGFASLFARRYLTWEARDPEARTRALAPFVGPGVEPDAGMQPPVGAGSSQLAQRVQWTEVVQAREPQLGEHAYTVAAQTDAAGLLYLAVSVVRQPSGELALAGYPALVGAPASGPADGERVEGLREVEEPALQSVLQRALRNYLAGSATELAADLTTSARVALPGLALSLQAIAQARWLPGGAGVLVIVRASDARGTAYTLAYEVDVMRAQGRWEIAAIQTNPDT